MIINNNNTSKQSVKTVGMTSTVTDGVTSTVTDGVTSSVTDGVTSLVTDGVTLFGSEKEGQTICLSSRCKLGHWNGVTLSVTLLVTLPVTNKKKKTKKEEIPPAPPKEEKNKKIKITHTNTHACEKKPKIVAKFAEK